MQQAAFNSSNGTTETNSNNSSNLSEGAGTINKKIFNDLKLIQYDGNGSLDILSKSGQQSTIKYDELQSSKFEHELVNNGNGFTSYPLQPKHIRFPDVPYSSEIVNELMIFVYTMIATAMQFLHLYRTVWWLPESNTSQTMVNSNYEY